MMSETAEKPSTRYRFGGELKEFSVIALYLYICFSALLNMKAAILHAEGVAFSHYSLAAMKALLCAKFICLGRVLGLGERFKNKGLIWLTLYRSVNFFVLILVLNAVEETIIGLVHHRPLADSILAVGGGTLDQLVGASIVMVLILIPFFAFRSLGEVVGEENLVRIFLRSRPTT